MEIIDKRSEIEVMEIVEVEVMEIVERESTGRGSKEMGRG